MNYLDPLVSPQREAKLKYLDGDFQVLREGEFVRCAISGDPIRVDNLRYWNIDLQRAYKSAWESFLDSRSPAT
jgi:hypothetical protein